MLEGIKDHLKKYWPYYAMGIAVPISFGVYTGIFVGMSDEKLSEIPTDSKQSACTLETNSMNKEACEFGMQAGYTLIQELLKKSGAPSFPDFSQLNPLCEKYYDDSKLTGSCLNGLVGGTQGGLQLGNDQQSIKKDALNNSLAHAAMVLPGLMLSFCGGYFYGKKNAAPEESQNNDETHLLNP